MSNKLGDVHTRDGLDGANALRGEHVRFDAPFPRMNGARPGGGDVRHAEVAEYVVPAGLGKACGMSVDHGQRLCVGDGDVVRRNANDRTCDPQEVSLTRDVGENAYRISYELLRLRATSGYG